jgi:hypothetical protein
MVLKMQDQLAGKVVVTTPAEVEGSLKEEIEVKPKISKVSKKKSKVVLKKPAAAPAAKEPRSMNETRLQFPKKLGKRPPSHHGESTIYTDASKKCWRLKLKRGDKHELYFFFSDDAKNSWAAMVKKVREQNK